MPTLTSRARPSLLRHLNAREILAALQRHGPLSRAEISRRTGISGPTITRTVTSLIAANLLEEGEFQTATLGRPGKVVRLASKKVSVLGVAVGARHSEMVIAGLDGEIDPEQVCSFDTPRRYGDLVKTLVRQTRRFQRANQTNVLGLGVSMPGLLNRREERTVFSPNLHQTDGRQLGVDLRRHLAMEVAMLQESHALCMAEQFHGAARGVADFAMLDISEGLGLGVVLGGRIVEGHSGMAGELGHVTVDPNGKTCGCGNRGCLETVATDTALAAAVSERLGRKLSAEEVVIRALALDAELDHVLHYLAIALAMVINVFNPRKLFLYGRLLDAGPQLFDRLLELTRLRALAPSVADCEVIRARGNKRLGAVAGIIHRLTTGREQPLA
jgi:N-acetylglucosamine repressor